MSAHDGPDVTGTGAPVESLVAVAERDRHFGRYLLRYEIASGGMATVYLARSRGPAGFDRPLALKRIHPHLASKREFVDMFLDEARLSARITHPNVCSVFDFGEVDGTYFMAMEYLVGQPLSGLLRALKQRPQLVDSGRWHALAASIIAAACEGLHAAHELRDDEGRPLQVVHRDVTPHNIFVTYDGAVKVVDFGVASAEGRLHQTETGGLKGKLAYMAPEQVARKDIDRRLDVWALGICLWELLTATRLFGKRSEVEVLQAVISAQIPLPSSVRPSVPMVLEEIVMRALERDVEERYPTARAMGRELTAYVSGSGVSAGLADLAELMEEVFAHERSTKLGVVASVLHTGSEMRPPQSQSGERRRQSGERGSSPEVSRPPAETPPAAMRPSDGLAPTRTAVPEVPSDVPAPARVERMPARAAAPEAPLERSTPYSDPPIAPRFPWGVAMIAIVIALAAIGVIVSVAMRRQIEELREPPPAPTYEPESVQEVQPTIGAPVIPPPPAP